MASRQTMFASLRNMAEEIGGAEKQAAAARVKQGEGPTPSDPGGYQGATTHPTKSVGNNVQSAETGARASENEKDVKADQGAPGVNSTPEATHKEGSGDQDSVQLNIGTTQSATGEDPSVEDDYKGTKDDPGTTHPAKTNDGEKYASLKPVELDGLCTKLANAICADLANGHGTKLASLNPAAHGDRPVAQPKVVGHSEGTQSVKTAADAPISEKIAAAAAAVSGARQAPTDQLAQGYELAGVLGVKLAAAQGAVAECLYNSRKDANLDADLVGSYFNAFKQKAAADADPSEGEDHSKPGDSSSGAGEGGGEGSHKEPDADNGGGGAPPMGGGAGGGSLGDALGGGSDPGGLMGGGGAPNVGGNEEQAIMQLISALDELGIPIEALAQAGGGAGGAGGAPGGDMGGAPPMGGAGGPPMGGAPGGAPPMGGDPLGGAGGGAPPMSEGMKLASACLAFKRSGRYKFAAANPGSPERALRNQMRSYVNELLAA